jgi:hypothetical protein
VVGDSTSLASSFSNQNSQSVSYSSGGSIPGFTTSQTTTISDSYTQEQDTSSSLAISQTTSDTTGVNDLADCNGASIHDHDLIYVWLNPILTFQTYSDISNYATWTGYGYDLNDTAAYPSQEVIALELGWLNGDIAFPTCNPGAGCASDRLARTWALNNVDGSGPGLTGNGAACVSGSGSDICNILAADPFSSSTYVPTFNPPSETTTDGRLTACSNSLCSDTIAISPGSYNNYSQGTSTTATQSEGAKFTYSQTYSVEDQFKGTGFLSGFSAALKNSTTLTWVNQFNQSTNVSHGQTAAFTIQGPSCWAGPANYDVYQDNLYGTFVFWPVQ